MNSNLITTILIDIILMCLLYSLQRFSFNIHTRLFSKGINASAIIGTPIHELSHCFLCVLCLHRIHKVSLYSPAEDGTLGYVTHSFNKGCLLSTAGGFLIGIAPLFGGILTIYLVSDILLPDSNINKIMSNVSTQQLNGMTTIFCCMLVTIKQILSSLLTILNYDSFFRIVLWFYLSGSIALHMSPSKADLHNSVTGIIVIISILVVSYLLLPQLTLSFIVSSLSILTIILTISLILASITLFVTLAIELTINILRKTKIV